MTGSLPNVNGHSLNMAAFTSGCSTCRLGRSAVVTGGGTPPVRPFACESCDTVPATPRGGATPHREPCDSGIFRIPGSLDFSRRGPLCRRANCDFRRSQGCGRVPISRHSDFICRDIDPAIFIERCLPPMLIFIGSCTLEA